MKRRFEELKCWQMAREYRQAIYKVTKSFPKEELFGLTNQIRRAACSVTANVAEGYGRYGFQDAAQFCVRARLPERNARPALRGARRGLHQPEDV